MPKLKLKNPLQLLRKKSLASDSSQDPTANALAQDASKSDQEAAKVAQGLVSVRDIIAPSAIEVDFEFVRIGDYYYRTLFTAGYPRYVGVNWLGPLINFDHGLDISMFYYPVETQHVVGRLQRKIAEMQSELNLEAKEGRILDPQVQLSIQDAVALQEQLTAGAERFFQFALYITIPARSIEELDLVTKRIESALGAILLVTKRASLQTEQGFKTTLPTFTDRIQVYRNMDTTSIATTFPFTSSELTANEGVLYGINEHNGSLVIFDRFKMENANMVIFAKSGAGKSYTVKLETLRFLMLGTEAIIIDPENEYKTLCEAIGGEFIEFSENSAAKVNPFELASIQEVGENELGNKILTLHGLFKVMFGTLSNEEEAILDRALIMTYKLKGITTDPDSQKNEPPLLEDLFKVLKGMEEAQAGGMADRLERYIKGSAKGIFDQKTTVGIHNPFTVFGIRDLEDTLRPIAMHIILDFIWTRIRTERKRRLLVVDEAWHLMQYPDSARFLFSIAKRARKYYLGLTTITQDTEDFLSTDFGKAIVTNSSIQLLMKQSSAAIDRLAEVFYLTEGEKRLLLASNIGEGIFFAGQSHVAMQVIASMDEHKLITTNPEELMRMEQARQAQAAGGSDDELRPSTT